MPASASRIAWLVVIVIGLALLSRDLTERFNGWHEFNSAAYSRYARNHIAYGLDETKLYCTRGVTAEPPSPPRRYLNHPPLLALQVAIPLALLGDHEWSARLVPILASLGSTLLLMTILARCGGALLGILGGLFFVMLPLTVHFGQMVDHVAPVQFLSLLMMHGYLHWSGAYGREAARTRRGALWYSLGAVVGIGTGWAAVLMAGLLFGWHALRVLRGQGEGRLLPWLAAVPGAALAAVILHITAGVEGDFGMLGALLARRAEASDHALPEWLRTQGEYLVRNFTVAGAAVAVFGAALVAPLLARARRGAGPLRLPLPDALAGVLAVTGLQGLVYVLAFRSPAWFHDYWQFFLGPFVAGTLALLAVAVHAVVKPAAPRLAFVAVAVLVAAPVPGLVASLRFYDRVEQIDPRYLEALEALSEHVPRRAPVWTARRPRGGREVVGGHVNRWSNAIEVYYSNRPLHYSRDGEEVTRNAPGHAAFLLPVRDKPWSRDLARTLSLRYKVVPVGDHHLIFLLDRPLPDGRADAPRRPSA